MVKFKGYLGQTKPILRWITGKVGCVWPSSSKMALPTSLGEFSGVSAAALQSQNTTDVSDKQTLLAVLQFLKKNNLKVRQ